MFELILIKIHLFDSTKIMFSNLLNNFVGLKSYLFFLDVIVIFH